MRGYLWAGPGNAWTKKENYFQIEDDQQRLYRTRTEILASLHFSLRARIR